MAPTELAVVQRAVFLRDFNFYVGGDYPRCFSEALAPLLPAVETLANRQDSTSTQWRELTQELKALVLVLRSREAAE